MTRRMSAVMRSAQVRLTGIALVSALASCGARPAATPPSAGPRAAEIAWQRDFNTALTKARAEKKPLMVDFYTRWCGWCKRLDETTYKDPQVVALAAKLVSVKIDAEAHRELAKKYRVNGYPTILFLNGKGEEIGRVVGYLAGPEFAGKLAPIVQERGLGPRARVRAPRVGLCVLAVPGVPPRSGALAAAPSPRAPAGGGLHVGVRGAQALL